MPRCIEITRAVFTTASTREREGGLLGWVACVIDGTLRLDGIVLRRTGCGHHTLSFPSRTDLAGKRHPYIQPVDDAARQHLEREIFKALRCDLEETSP